MGTLHFVLTITLVLFLKNGIPLEGILQLCPFLEDFGVSQKIELCLPHFRPKFGVNKFHSRLNLGVFFFPPTVLQHLLS